MNFSFNLKLFSYNSKLLLTYAFQKSLIYIFNQIDARTFVVFIGWKTCLLHFNKIPLKFFLNSITSHQAFQKNNVYSYCISLAEILTSSDFIGWSWKRNNRTYTNSNSWNLSSKVNKSFCYGIYSEAEFSKG